jgi:hypothetical protein
MNIAKHMEIIFVAAAVIAGATTYASAASDYANAIAVPVESVYVVDQAATAMPTVTVTAKRLTAAEKAAL